MADEVQERLALSSRTLGYAVVDVFSVDRIPFAGNPLAVVLGADGVATEALQALAREFHLSETAFPLPPTASGADYRLRIFTPQGELPFAGHPSIGSAWVVRELGLASPTGGVLSQECGAGVLPLRFLDDGRVELTGGPCRLGPPLEPAPLLTAAGLVPDDAADGPPPRVAGTGVDVMFLPVRPDAVGRVEVDGVRLAAVAGAATQLAVIAWSPADRTAHVRIFAPALGVPEDPATGSAATALGVWLVDAGLVPGEGETAYEIRQGAEIGRPSLLSGTVVARSGRAVQSRVAGTVVPVARGEVAVPPG